MKDTTVIFKLTKDLKTALDKEADKKGLSLSAYIRLILLERNKEKNND